MTRRFKSLVFTFAVFAVFQIHTANAEVRLQMACPIVSGFPPGTGSLANRCLSGLHGCTVGVRGDWLDITNTVEIIAGPGADISAIEKGVDFGGVCVPRAAKSREGYVKFNIANIERAGTLRLRLNRPGGSDTISIEVRDGSTYLRPVQTAASRFTKEHEPKVFALSGKNLDKLVLTRASAIDNAKRKARGGSADDDDAILGKTETTAQVRLTFGNDGTHSLEEKLSFEGAEPLNALPGYGWPTVRVDKAPPLPSANLIPVAPDPPLRVLGSAAPGRTGLSTVFCAGKRPQEEGEVAVHPFTWGAKNAGNLAVNGAFTVVLKESNGNVLDTKQVPSLAAGATVTFTNWPGRQARIRVKNEDDLPKPPSTGNSVVAPGSTNPSGCHLAGDRSGVKFDPVLIVHVQSVGLLKESSEGDNTKTIP